MTREEMSVEFDLLYNNIMSNLAPGLDDYEKSRFLTMAQEAIVKEYYNGISPLANSFEKNEAMRRSLADLITSWSKNINDYVDVQVVTPTNPDSIPDTIHPMIGSGTKLYDYTIRIPKDVMYIIYEYVFFNEKEGCLHEKEIPVIPVTHDDFTRIKNNPFKGPSTRRVLRLDYGRYAKEPKQFQEWKLNRQVVEIISKYEIYSYTMRYLGRPTPIIISDLDKTDVPINGQGNAIDCMLSELIHRDIVERAVQIAAAVYKGSATNNK